MRNLAESYLGKKVKVVIDRPLGSKHPKHGFEYLVNYGFIPGTKAEDGEEVDAYVLGVNEPLKEFTGLAVAVIHRTNDSDDKVIVVPAAQRGITDDKIKKDTLFQEKYFKSIILKKEF